MRQISGGVAHRSPFGKWLALVVLGACLPGLTGCREDPPVAAPIQQPQLYLHVNAGDSFSYVRWSLDQYGYIMENSAVPERWRVLQTGVPMLGDTDVVVVVDTIGTGSPETLLFRFTAAGEVYQYGFLSRVIREMGGGNISPQWDVLARSGQSVGSSWVAGVSDSVGTDTVYGQFTGDSKYFSVRLNGTSTVFTVYHVVLYSQRVQYDLWLTDSPSCMTTFQEGSTAAGNGFVASLTSMTAVRP